MKKISKSASKVPFSREHLWAIIGTLLVSLHVVDDLARLGDPFPPPFIPLLIATALYGFMPIILRIIIALIFGVTFSIAQIFGHLTPLLERPLGGSDYTGMIGLVGGLILISIAGHLIKNRFSRSKST